MKEVNEQGSQEVSVSLEQLARKGREKAAGEPATRECRQGQQLAHNSGILVHGVGDCGTPLNVKYSANICCPNRLWHVACDYPSKLKELSEK